MLSDFVLRKIKKNDFCWWILDSICGGLFAQPRVEDHFVSCTDGVLAVNKFTTIRKTLQ